MSRIPRGSPAGSRGDSGGGFHWVSRIPFPIGCPGFRGFRQDSVCEIPSVKKWVSRILLQDSPSDSVTHSVTGVRAVPHGKPRQELVTSVAMRAVIALVMLAIVEVSGIQSEPESTEIPTGTQIEVRLKSKIASNSSKVNDPVEAVVIAPVMQGNRIDIAPGTLASGTVKDLVPITTDNPRASILLQFVELTDKDGNKMPMEAQLVQIDNARESLDESGRILGILASETISSRMDDGLQRLGNRLAGLASILQTAKDSFVNQANPEIEYGPGVEMTLKLVRPLQPKSPGTSMDAYAKPIQPEGDLGTLVNAQPFQTVAQKPPRPSDITNLMFIGSRADIEHAFAEAGWATASDLDAKAKVETIRALVENRGYSEAPVSVLLLEEQEPDLVFEKLNNTFASRHHLRVWKRPDAFGGQDVWVCAATHDIGIDFSPKDRTFIHKIDSQIDRERAKVVCDLMFTRLIKGLSLVDRPAVPKTSSNATGDKLLTDGKMAVLLF
jgi:hypothetical protein